MKRVFIAIKIEPGDELLKMFSSFKSVLKNESIKWTETSNIHITLVFLGDTEEKRITEIDQLLAGVCTGFGEFELKLRGAGVFRNIRDPRVIWAGINFSKEMADLNKAITGKLQETGTPLENRSFNPHLTLGRIKRINDISLLSGLLENYTSKEIQPVKVTEIIFFESILRPEGPIYKPLGTYLL
ncbi:MAG: RNA 2',3'-cyclic phosphodiesterase [Bacteroidetes bacterium]|nr:RNA 2',3'-cyclic phosphodiesterase [Bacteroidota bacterium]